MSDVKRPTIQLRKLPRVLTTGHVEGPQPTPAQAAETLGLSTHIERYRTGRHQLYTYTRYEIGTVLVDAFTEPRWRDLGEGPSWQEKYNLPMTVRVPLLWEPAAHQAVSFKFPVVSLLRQGGAKWGGVSVAARDDTTEQPSTHSVHTYGYDAFKQMAEGTLFGWQVRLERGVTFREEAYQHDPSRSHYVMDLSADTY